MPYDWAWRPYFQIVWQLFPEEEERIAEEAIKSFETVAHTARYTVLVFV